LKDGTYTKEPGDNFLAPHLCRVVEGRKVKIVPLVDHPVQAGYINIEEEQHKQNLLAKENGRGKVHVVFAFKI
jgi:hypothetical protein